MLPISQKIKNIPIYVTAIQLYLFDAIMKYCTLQQSTTQTLDTEKKNNLTFSKTMPS